MDLINNELKAKKGNLLNDIQVAQGAIVSKTLIKNPGGNISLFALDQGQQISEHKAPYDVLITVLDGEIDFSVSGEIYNLKNSDYLVCPADAPHGMNCIKPSKVIISMYKK